MVSEMLRRIHVRVLRARRRRVLNAFREQLEAQAPLEFRNQLLALVRRQLSDLEVESEREIARSS